MTCQLPLEVDRDKLEEEDGKEGEEDQDPLHLVSFHLDFLNLWRNLTLKLVMAAIPALPGQIVLVESGGIRHQTLMRPFGTCIGCIPAEVIGVFVLNLDS